MLITALDTHRIMYPMETLDGESETGERNLQLDYESKNQHQKWLKSIKKKGTDSYTKKELKRKNIDGSWWQEYYLESFYYESE
jgi:hypothetical protein